MTRRTLAGIGALVVAAGAFWWWSAGSSDERQVRRLFADFAAELNAGTTGAQIPASVRRVIQKSSMPRMRRASTRPKSWSPIFMLRLSPMTKYSRAPTVTSG